MNLNIKQKNAFDKLSKLKAGALFMKMGTGKTKVAIDLAISRQNNFDCIIWIAPASLVREENYQEEIKKWSKNLVKPIHFYSVEGVSASDNKFLEMRNLAENTKNFCIVDESITIKNTDAGRTRRLLDMWNLFDFRLILNGTALTKGLIDLYSQIQFIHPKILSMTETQFANNFLTYKKDGYKSWKRWSKPENEEALIEIIRPYIFDAELEIDCNINYNDINCKLSEKEKQEYHEVKENYLEHNFNGQFLPMAQKFHHQYTINNDKTNKLLELLRLIKQRNEKVIIYVKYIDEVLYLKDNFDFVEYTGNKKDNLEEFKNNKDILVCTYGVGSFGLNLQFANNIIYLTQTFDYKDKEQSKHRVYRTGQKKDVNIYNFWVNTGLENLIKKSLDKKENVLANVEKIISNKELLSL